jgi:glyoxylase-like metal-dependent hydrolase (beta-lactamase superfamily II)
MREVRPGVWHWQARHPEWRETEPWHPEVSSYAIDDGEQLLLFDPIAPPAEIERLIPDRTTAIVLTSPWHERDTEGLVERHAVPVYSPLPDSKEYIMETWNLTEEQVGDGSPDLRWLIAGDAGELHPYSAGDRLPVGIEVFPGQKPNDVVLWVEPHRVVIAGDTLPDFGEGLALNPRWFSPKVTREQVVSGLSPLLSLPVEHVLATHGGPFDRADLERALA